MISARVKGYLEQLKTARAHLPTAVKYLVADSFYSKKSVVDGVIDLDIHLVSKLRITESCWSGFPICDKLRNDRSFQAGLSGWLKEK